MATRRAVVVMAFLLAQHHEAPPLGESKHLLVTYDPSPPPTPFLAAGAMATLARNSIDANYRPCYAKDLRAAVTGHRHRWCLAAGRCHTGIAGDGRARRQRRSGNFHCRSSPANRRPRRARRLIVPCNQRFAHYGCRCGAAGEGGPGSRDPFLPPEQRASTHMVGNSKNGQSDLPRPWSRDPGPPSPAAPHRAR